MATRPLVMQRSNSFSVHPSHSKTPSASNAEAENESSSNSVPMSSSLITQWIRALASFDKRRLKEALQLFQSIESKTSKIHYNIASIYAILGDNESAIESFKLAINCDNYLAIAYFQIGVCRFLSGQYKTAAGSFNTSLKLLRGNSVINYQQLGLEYKLYSCEIMYNRALSYIYSGQMTVGIYDLGFAVRERRFIPEHSMLDDALRHFSQSGNSKANTSAQSDFSGSNAGRSQRFSVLCPPQPEPSEMRDSPNGYNVVVAPSMTVIPNSSSHGNSADPVEKSSMNESTPQSKKEMVYCLFSVPQGAVFRLTENKVQTMLNRKYSGSHPNVIPPSSTGPGIGRGSRDTPKPHNIAPMEGEASTISTGSTSNSYRMHERHVKTSSTGSAGSDSTPRNQRTSPPLRHHRSNPTISSGMASTNSNATSPYSSFSASHSSQSSLSTTSSAHSRNRSKPPLQSVSELPDLSSYEDQEEKTLVSYEIKSGAQLYPPETLTNHQDQIHDMPVEDDSTLGHRSERRAVTPSDFNFSYGTHYIDGSNRRASINYQNMSISHQQQNLYAPPNITPPSPPNFENTQIDNPQFKHAYEEESIKIKIHYAGETRVMLLTRSTSFTDFKRRLVSKLDLDRGDSRVYNLDSIYIRIKDEDGDYMLLGDQEDLDVALEEQFVNRAGNTKVKLAVYVEVMN